MAPDAAPKPADWLDWFRREVDPPSVALAQNLLAARTTAGRPLDPPWVVATGDGPQGAYGIAVPVLGVPGLEASVGVLALRELNDADVGPRVARAAGEIARALR